VGRLVLFLPVLVGQADAGRERRAWGVLLPRQMRRRPSRDGPDRVPSSKASRAEEEASATRYAAGSTLARVRIVAGIAMDTVAVAAVAVLVAVAAAAVLVAVAAVAVLVAVAVVAVLVVVVVVVVVDREVLLRSVQEKLHSQEVGERSLGGGMVEILRILERAGRPYQRDIP
jgi:Flp pilus assembly protein TadB